MSNVHRSLEIYIGVISDFDPIQQVFFVEWDCNKGFTPYEQEQRKHFSFDLPQRLMYDLFCEKIKDRMPSFAEK